jgi:hypothetical protein
MESATIAADTSFGYLYSRLLRQLQNPSRAVLILLALPAVISLSVGVFEALHRNIDLQWSGARLVALHQDPWAIMASGDPQHQIILGQQPNYLPQLYILLLPLGLMSFWSASIVWIGLSLALAAMSLWMTIKLFNLAPIQALICADVFLASTPLRVALANGQQATLLLAFLAASFYCTSRGWKGVWLGLSYFKYSFAPVIVLTWFFDSRYLTLACSMVIPVLGVLSVYFLTHSHVYSILLGPILTAETVFASSYGFADIMSVTQTLVLRSNMHSRLWLHLPELVAVLASIGAAAHLHRQRRNNEAFRAALIMTWTLLIFRHLIYDFIVLVLPFAAALVSKRSWSKVGVFVILAYFWFGCSIVNRLILFSPSLPLLAVNCVALCMLLWLLSDIEPQNSMGDRRDADSEPGGRAAGATAVGT